MSATIGVTYVRRAEAYRIDEVGGDGVVRAEISPAWLCDEAFAEHLAGLVAGYRGLEVSRGVIEDDGVVVLEWERRRGRQQGVSASRRGSPGAGSAARSPRPPGGLEARRAGS